jgi:hypothetical protein
MAGRIYLSSPPTCLDAHNQSGARTTVPCHAIAPTWDIAIDVAWALRLQTPQTPFSPTPGSMPANAPPALRQPESDPGSDLSLARNGCALQRLHSGVNVPGLPLQISRLTSFRPVRPFGSTTSAGSPQPRLLLRLGPVAGSLPIGTSLLEHLRSPSRPFTASRDQSVQRPSSQWTLLPAPPDSRSLPAAVVC